MFLPAKRKDWVPWLCFRIDKYRSGQLEGLQPSRTYQLKTRDRDSIELVARQHRENDLVVRGPQVVLSSAGFCGWGRRV